MPLEVLEVPIDGRSWTRVADIEDENLLGHVASDRVLELIRGKRAGGWIAGDRVLGLIQGERAGGRIASDALLSIVGSERDIEGSGELCGPGAEEEWSGAEWSEESAVVS